MIQLKLESNIFFLYSLYFCYIFDMHVFFIFEYFIRLFNKIKNGNVFYLFFYLNVKILSLFFRRVNSIIIKESLFNLFFLENYNLSLSKLFFLKRFDFLILSKRNVLR